MLHAVPADAEKAEHKRERGQEPRPRGRAGEGDGERADCGAAAGDDERRAPPAAERAVGEHAEGDASEDAARLGERQVAAGGEQCEPDHALEVEREERHPDRLHRGEHERGAGDEPEVARAEHGGDRPALTRGAAQWRLAGWIAVDARGEHGARDDHQRARGDRPAPAQAQRQRGHQRGSEHAAEGQADLLEPDHRGALARRKPRHGRRRRRRVERAVADTREAEQRQQHAVGARGAGGEQAAGDERLAEHERLRGAPAIGEHAGEERHRDRPEVVDGEEGAGLRQRQPEVVTDQRGDGGNAEGADVGDGLRQHDDREDRPALAHRPRAASSACTACRSSSVSTPTVASVVSTTVIGMPFSRKRSCSSRSVCSSSEGGRRWKASSAARR